MYLKRLEMQGFKSFVDKISLDFGNGITAIVGPNGSGKSNISDAIRWVMGEQSVKSLRGSKMEDVIFAGTEKRKPTGFAQVSLYLDNSTKIFPIDYDEVAVTRRVYRSGESEYFINKAVCRLRDIHELFMDTGLGRDGYSIIGQGKIDEIISGKAEDRRQIFEEAAGISKYKYKKAEAQRRLASTDDNLERVCDIASELEQRLTPLQGQSEKALRYLALRDELKILDVNLALIAIDETKKEKEHFEQVLADTHAQSNAESQTLSKLRHDEETAYAGMRETEGVLEQIKERLHTVDLLCEKTNGEIQLLQNNIKLYSDEKEKSVAEIKVLEEEIATSNRGGENEKKEIEILFQQRTQETADIDKINAQLLEHSSVTDEKNAALASLLEKASSYARQADMFQSKISTLDALDTNYEERIKQLEQSATQSECDSAQALSNLNGFEVQITGKRAVRDEETEKLDTLKQNAELARQETVSQKAAYNKKSDEYNKSKTRLQILSDMEKNMEGYGAGVKALMSSGFAKTINIHGLLTKLITSEEKYYTAVEIGLAGALQNVVVESEEDAKAAIRYLKENHAGRVTFLPVSSVSGRRGNFENDIKNIKGSLGLLCDKVDANPIYREIIENLLGQTALFDNMDNAVAAARKFRYRFKIVTLGGEVIYPGGSMTGGSTPHHSRLLGRDAEIKKLSALCSKLEQEMDIVEERIDKSNECFTMALGDIEKTKEAINTLDAEIVRLLGECELQRRISEREKAEAEKRYAELEMLADAGKNSERERAILSEKAEKSQHSADEIRVQAEEMRMEIRTLIEKREKLSSLIIEKRMKISDINGSIELCNMRISSAQADALSKQQRIRLLQDNVNALDTKTTQTALLIENKKTDIAEARKQGDTLQSEITEMAQQRQGADESIVSLKAAAIEQNDRVNAINMELTRLEGKLEKYTERLDATVAMLWNEYELSYPDAFAMKSDIGDIADAKKRAAQLKSQIKNLGHINIDSIEEYKEVSKRYEFLSSQINDLERAKTELSSLISEMTDAMKTQFAEQFEIISSNFTQVFKELFGGGSAALSLCDPTDILESGIEIDVRPPGKKLQRLSLLSGGEMAFTAIALLFSILKVRPTPFCILDEIEAALDDNNIARFCNYIKNFSNTTQFIVVTHRRGTMEAADILYGVTMQEKGVSKLLTMKLDEVKFEGDK